MSARKEMFRPFRCWVSVVRRNTLNYCLLPTDTPYRGCRSSTLTSTMSYKQIPIPNLKKVKHVFVIVFVIVEKRPLVDKDGESIGYLEENGYICATIKRLLWMVYFTTIRC